MKTAEELYLTVLLKGVSSFTKEELHDICKMILKARGDRATAVGLAKKLGWWDDAVAEPCQAILNAPGNRAWTIYYMRQYGLWNDSVAEPCQAILDAPGDRASAIYLAKQAGWWNDSVAEPCQAILDAPGNRVLTIFLAKQATWWKEPVAKAVEPDNRSPDHSNFYIVWNEAKTEGFITQDHQLAYEVRKGSDMNCYHEESGGQCQTGIAFIYEWPNDTCSIEEVSIDKSDTEENLYAVNDYFLERLTRLSSREIEEYKRLHKIKKNITL